MLIGNPADMRQALLKGQRLLGLDVGQKTIGLAVSDPGWTVASPLKTIQRTKYLEDIRELGTIRQAYGIGGFVVGLPINMDGTEGPMAQSVRKFVEGLFKHQDLVGGDIPVFLWDERFSTQAVTRLMLEWDMTRQKRDAAVDKMAASYILQGFLERVRQMSS